MRCTQVFYLIFFVECNDNHGKNASEILCRRCDNANDAHDTETCTECVDGYYLWQGDCKSVYKLN